MAIFENGHEGRAASRISPVRPGGVEMHDPRRSLAPAPAPRRGGHGAFWVYLIVLLLVLGAVVAFVLIRKQAQSTQLNQTTQEMATPTVLVIRPERASGSIHLTLPGAVQAVKESSVYAQISGYIKSWNTDIGAPVKAGELMATIEAPVIEQNLFQVQANLGQAQANLALAQTTAARYNNLLATHAVAQQDVDNQNANVAVMKANVAAAEAGVKSIQNQLAFRSVTAPFDGVVTERRVDVGDLVSAAGGTATNTGTQVAGTTPASGGSTELFEVAQVQILRVYVTVPEKYSTAAVPGVKATINLASNPNESVPGTLVRTSSSIDPISLTLLAEIDIDNRSGRLLPGGYAQVHLDLPDANPPLLIPGNSLIFRAQGTQVGVVGADGKVMIKDIKVGRDFGTKLEVLDGIDENDQVIVNPSDSITGGTAVHVKEQKTDAAKGAKS